MGYEPSHKPPTKINSQLVLELFVHFRKLVATDMINMLSQIYYIYEFKVETKIYVNLSIPESKALNHSYLSSLRQVRLDSSFTDGSQVFFRSSSRNNGRRMFAPHKSNQCFCNSTRIMFRIVEHWQRSYSASHEMLCRSDNLKRCLGLRDHWTSTLSDVPRCVIIQFLSRRV